MAAYIARRIGVSILILIAASFIMYVLAAGSGDPLRDLRGGNAANEAQLIAARVSALDLDVPAPLRWFLWLGGAAKCLVPFANSCDLGLTLDNAPVATILPTAMVSTLQLVTVATVVAIILGVVIGIVTALRQYSGFDIATTFLSFFLFSLPSFLIAVLLKEFIAIGFNDFLQDGAAIPAWLIVVIALVAGLIWMVLIGGSRRRRLIVFGVSAVATGAVLVYVSLTSWFLFPGLGPVGLLVVLAGVVFITTSLVSGLANRRALLASAITAAFVYIAFFVLQGLFTISSAFTLIFIAVAALVVGIVVGFLVGGSDRGQAVRAGAITGIVSMLLVFLDRFMQAWPSYVESGRINGRPIATVGSGTPGLTGDVWVTGIDSFTHLLLPTIALLLISFAQYTRYARAGLLEVLNQDYIRTARAKGLPERTVIMRHAFRNMLIPIATIVATDVGALLGGAVITEKVFAISGMGNLFATALGRTDLNPIMGYFIVIAIVAIAFNFLADLAYAALDPRVRVR
ncbi:ABC transporter permease subunit [Agreia bicolorata]|uniref:ABC transporter permease n=1 Tax=Agreia bicolorata TaxID=110935 RepID=A0ABR5CJC4_9MICO|nr:ABC transporter permease subunit [Agreia bicolorata]KJC65661.1 ABC transporter permease [Agreia bicolorata]